MHQASDRKVAGVEIFFEGGQRERRNSAALATYAEHPGQRAGGRRSRVESRRPPARPRSHRCRRELFEIAGAYYHRRSACNSLPPTKTTQRLEPAASRILRVLTFLIAIVLLSTTRIPRANGTRNGAPLSLLLPDSIAWLEH